MRILLIISLMVVMVLGSQAIVGGWKWNNLHIEQKFLVKNGINCYQYKDQKLEFVLTCGCDRWIERYQEYKQEVIDDHMYIRWIAKFDYFEIYSLSKYIEANRIIDKMYSDIKKDKEQLGNPNFINEKIKDE